MDHPYKIIFFVCVALYIQILTFGLVHFDDHGFVLMAADNLKLSNIPQFFNHSVFWVLGDTTQQYDVFYRPLQNVVYAVCNTIATKQPWIYHVTGLSFHIFSCYALFAFLKEIKYHPSTALMFTLIYCVHPVLAQGVAWIAGIGDQMATMLSLLSITFFIKVIGQQNKLNLKHLTICLLTLAGALFSKEVSIIVIPLCLFIFFILNKNKSLKNILPVLAGWIAIALIYFILRSHALPSTKTGIASYAFESLKANAFLILEYFEKMFLPYRLSPIPSREDAQILIGAIILLLLIAILIVRKKFTPMTILGTLWFIAFLFPTFIQQNPDAHFFAFEHRLYLPLIGILIILIELIHIDRINLKANFQKYGFALILLLFFGITFSHTRTFADPYTFYRKAIFSSPKSVIAYNGYGKLLLEDKKYAEAIEAFKKSFEYKSDDIQTTGKIGEIYMKNLNDPKDAIVWFNKTLKIDSTSIEAAVSIGDAYWNILHDTANAIISYTNALKIDPKNEFAPASLGVIFSGKGNTTEARNFFSKSLNANPKNLLSLKWMAISYFNEGKISEAISYLNKGYENYPNDIDVNRNLMICYYKSNNFDLTKRFAAFCSQNNNPIPEEIKKYLNTH